MAQDAPAPNDHSGNNRRPSQSVTVFDRKIRSCLHACLDEHECMGRHHFAEHHPHREEALFYFSILALGCCCCYCWLQKNDLGCKHKHNKLAQRHELKNLLFVFKGNVRARDRWPVIVSCPCWISAQQQQRQPGPNIADLEKV